MYVAVKRFGHNHQGRNVSKKSVMGFVKFMLSIQPPRYYFHQTLSFAAPMLDSVRARSHVNRFLKTLCKRFRKNDMGAVFVEERRQDGTIHYHVSFLFFDEMNLPFYQSQMEDSFRAYVFRHWCAENGGKSVHGANRLWPVAETGIKTGDAEKDQGV